VDRAYRAIEERCARPLGLDVLTVAHGIIEIANAAMTNALRLVSIHRGHDPRQFAMVAFGGAGPVHANHLAAQAEIPTAIIPMSPGTTSALGLLVTDLQHDYAVTVNERADQVDLRALDRVFRDLEANGCETLAREGVGTERIRFLRQLEMRYAGQSYELTIPLSNGRIDAAALAATAAAFNRAHEQTYGFSAPGEPVEIVNVRLTAIGLIAKPRLREAPGSGNGARGALKETRPVWFTEAGGFVSCPILDRYQLGAGTTISGPAVIEEKDSTTVVHPGFLARVDRFGNLVVTPGGGGAA